MRNHLAESIKMGTKNQIWAQVSACPPKHTLHRMTRIVQSESPSGLPSAIKARTALRCRL